MVLFLKPLTNGNNFHKELITPYWLNAINLKEV